MTGYTKQAGSLGRCAACEGPVIWARDAAEGTLDALDRDPRDDGDCHFVDDETYEVVSRDRAAELREVGVSLRFRHIVTCPKKRVVRMSMDELHESIGFED